MSLLQGVLRAHAIDSPGLRATPISRSTSLDNRSDSDDELVNVFSLPGTPGISRAPSRAPSRATSPTRTSNRALKLLQLPRNTPQTTRDPLKLFPTELSQRIFARLSIIELAACARVSKKWGKSQTINYIWFQHYRKENFRDDSLPPGKWTKKESKQNWRLIYLQPSTRINAESAFTPSSGYASPSLSGYQTPRELKEEQWRLEALTDAKPDKIEMRGVYKELGGRKAKAKKKLGGTGGIRDKGGWGEEGW